MSESMMDFIGAIQKEMAVKPEDPTVTADAIKQHLRWMASRGYEPSAEIVPVVRDWLRGYGILLLGETGRGKTFFFQVHTMPDQAIHICHVNRIVGFGFQGQDSWRESTDNYNLVIDDLGAEPIVSEYGAKDDLMKSVIAHRADHVKKRTCITTNMDGKQIVERYGDRTMSRILGMCKPHKLTGEHRRRVAGI